MKDRDREIEIEREREKSLLIKTIIVNDISLVGSKFLLTNEKATLFNS